MKNVWRIPKPYADELLYSVYARSYIYSGCVNFRNFAKEIFMDFKGSSNMEFTHHIQPEIKKLLTQDRNWEDILIHHTMFPYYGRFMDEDNRNQAFQVLKSMAGYYFKYLPIPVTRKNEEKRYLRYCPLCTREDRENFGETYWHRAHQLVGVDVCPVHGCYLMDSQVVITGNKKEDLSSAELVCDSTQVILGNFKEIKLAGYVNEVFQSDMSWKPNISISKFLYSKMLGTKYVTPGSQQKNKKKLFEDMRKYYKDIKDSPYVIRELWQVDKVLKGECWQFMLICQMADFLNVSVKELVECTG